MARLRVPRRRGRLRTRPDVVIADKAYSSRAIRAHLRKRGIRAVIPIPADQRNHRLRRGSQGGRPSTGRRTSSATPSSGASTASSSGAASPPATRRPRPSTWPDSTSPASSSGPPD
ncbi:LOW QUALITY PROTEIN: transposase IS4 family protein, partial [Streptomyces viridosporus ATCC 14672]